MKKNSNFEFSVIGFIFALFIVALFGTVLGVSVVELNENYGENVNSSQFEEFDKFSELEAITDEMRESTEYDTDRSLLDIVGGFLSNGISTLKLTWTSFDLFGDLLGSGTKLFPWFSLFESYLASMVIVGAVLGIFIAVMIKWRI